MKIQLHRETSYLSPGNLVLLMQPYIDKKCGFLPTSIIMKSQVRTILL